MTASQKQTLKHLLRVLVILVVLLAAVVLIRRHQASKAQEADASASTSAQTVTDSDVAYNALTYSNGTATLSFALNDDGEWYWVDDPDFPLDGDYITKIVNTISGLYPQQTITGGDTLEAYGLDDPAMTLTATAADDSSLTCALGNQAAGESNDYYLMLNGDDSTVYVITDTLHSELSNGIYDMMALPELPVLDESQLVSVTVTGRERDPVTLTASVSAAAEASADSSAADGSQTEQTVSWSVNGTDVTDSQTVQDLISAVRTLKLDRCVDYKPSSSVSALCGLDDPRAVVSVVYRDGSGEEQTLELTVGGATASDESSLHVRLAEDSTIYAMTTDTLSGILAVADAGLNG